MPTTISGSSGVSKVQDGVIVQADLAPNVVGNGPAFRAFPSAITVLTASIWTKLTLGYESFDVGNCFDTVNSRFQPNVAGYYLLTATVRFSGTSMTGTALQLYKNGASHMQVAAQNNPASTRTETLCGTGLVYLNGVSDYVEVWGLIQGGTGLSFETVSEAVGCSFQGFLARAA